MRHACLHHATCLSTHRTRTCLIQDVTFATTDRSFGTFATFRRFLSGMRARQSSTSCIHITPTRIVTRKTTAQYETLIEVCVWDGGGYFRFVFGLFPLCLTGLIMVKRFVFILLDLHLAKKFLKY